MGYQLLLILATLFAIGAFLVLVIRIGYPRHRQLAGLLYGIGWIPFVLSIHQFWISHQSDAHFLMRWKGHILVGVALIVLAWMFKVLIPIEKSPLLEVDEDELPAILDADLDRLAVIDRRMQESATMLVKNPVASAARISTDEARELQAAWARFIESSFELDLLKMRYRAFYQVNGFRLPKLHAKAFVIAYGAFVSQFRAASAVAALVRKNEAAKRRLDDSQPESGLPSGSFTRVQLMLSRPDEILRLNAGRAYLKLMKRRLEATDSNVVRTEAQLHEITRMVFADVDVFVKNPLDVFEQEASNAWFPVQKGVALGMASIRTVSRDYFITSQDLGAVAGRWRPGDIMLTRREWHLTNLGIPGYWTHAAIHVGSISQIDDLFAGIAILNGERPSDVLRKRYPDAFRGLERVDRDGEGCVIEALRPGVIIQSLADSATADSLAVLRPRVSQSDSWEAINRAFTHFGKPYNYQFDFRIDSALVCSQLVYKAYEASDGLHLKPTLSGGRLLLSPNEIAIKCSSEMGTNEAELELVSFLDGSGIGRVNQRSEAEFCSSWSRPKWHIVFQDDEEDRSERGTASVSR